MGVQDAGGELEPGWLASTGARRPGRCVSCPNPVRTTRVGTRRSVGTRVCMRVAAVAVALFAIPRDARPRRPPTTRRRRSTSFPRASTAACRRRPAADDQAQMYDGLTPLFDQVTDADLTTYFKSERFGVGTDGPGTAGDRPAPRGDDHPRQVQRPARHRARPTTAGSGPPGGSPPRTAACCSSRPATTPASPRSTPRASARSA